VIRPALGEGLLFHDLALLTRLRAEGLLVGLPPLEALVKLRRARGHGQGSRLLADAIARLELEATPTADVCSDCHGSAWRTSPAGRRICGNCGLVVEPATRGAR
jgi:hypothetical protein